ncbi:putative ribonuclease H-like domain-containing protein [Tanacetum coccineum]
MKAVKEKEQLQKTVDSWKNSSKNLWKLVFRNDILNKPLYSRYSKTNNFKGVPHPLYGDYTLKPQEEIDDSLYVYGKKGPQKPEISNSDDNSTKDSTSQSNDIWNNANRVNRANHFVPRSVQLNAVRSNVNTGRTNVNFVRHNVNSVRTNINIVRSKQPVPTNNTNSFSPVRTQMNKFNQRSHFSKSHSPVRRPIVRNTARMTYSHAVKGNWGTAVKRPSVRTSTQEREDKGIFDSWMLMYMTGNKDHLDDFEECKGGSVTFGGSKGYITGKGRIRVGNLDFDSVSFVKELGHFNLFSISQICDKHHKVLFTKTECLVVSPDFKMPDENQILLKVPRQHNMYSFDMKTPSLTKDYACLIAKATSDESKLWHRRFSWVFFLATKDETSGILQNFIRQIENQLNHRNGVAERMNRTLIEAARTMLADSLLPTTFWAEAVSTACYIFNRVRVTKPQNKTPYELLFGHKPIISYIRPFGCHVTILDTLSVLGKFDEKCDEGFLVGYSLNSKAFRVYNLVTKKVEVNLHVKFLEEKSNVKGVGYRWMFDIDYLTDSMNYIPVSLENQTNPHAGTSEVTNSAGTLQTPNANVSEEEDEAEELIVVPTALKHTAAKVGPRMSSTNSKAEEFLTELQNLKTQEKAAYSTGISEDTPEILAFRKELDELAQKHLREVPKNKATSTNSVNSGSGQDNTQPADQDDSDMPELTIFNKPQKGIFDEASYDDEGMVHDFNNLPTEVAVSPIPTLRIHNIHPQSQILGDPKSSVQTRSRVQKHSGAHALEEPKKISKALQDDSWVEAMQEELLQFRLQQVWILVDLPHRAKEEGIDYYEVFAPVARIKLSVKQKTDGIFISQDKYVADMLKKFDLASVKIVITPMDTKMALTKNKEADEVAVHLYRFMIGSLMYLTASRPDIMFAVCACSRFQVTPKTSHLNAVKRIFKYLKGKPNLGLWYPRESSFDMESFSDSDYAGANLDRKSTTGGCQFLGSRLISWQCKK